MAVRRWKAKPGNHGLDLYVTEWPTNICYADVSMLYARSLPELREMMDMLSVEFKVVGLILKPINTHFFTTVDLLAPMFVDGAGGMVEVLTGTDCHTYLGRHLRGSLQ